MYTGVLKQYAEVLELRSSTRQGVEMIFGSAHKNILQDSMFYYFDDLTKEQFVFCERVYNMLKSTLVPCETADAAYKLHDALRNKQTRRNAGPTENKNLTKMRTELVQKLTAFRESYAATIGDNRLKVLEILVPYPEETDGFNKWYGSYSDLYFRRPCIVKWGDDGLPMSDIKFTMKPVKNKNKKKSKKSEVPDKLPFEAFTISFPWETNEDYYKTVTIDKLKPDGDAAVLKEKCIALRQAATEWLQRHSTADISAATDAALHLIEPVPAVVLTDVPPAAAAAAAAAIDAKSSATASTTTATATVDKTSTQSAAAAAVAAAAVTDVTQLAPSSTTPTPPAAARSDTAPITTATVDTTDTTAAPVSTVKPTSPPTLLPSKATIAHLWNPVDCKKAVDAVCNERNFLVNDDYYADFPQAQAEATMTAIINYFTCVRKACDLLRDGDKRAKQRITELNKKKETAGAL
jgi:hypothetical protein